MTATDVAEEIRAAFTAAGADGYAYAREVATGRLDPTERTTVGGRYRIGGIGTAGCADDVEMSWRDLAYSMLTMSDNAATDIAVISVNPHPSRTHDLAGGSR